MCVCVCVCVCVYIVSFHICINFVLPSIYLLPLLFICTCDDASNVDDSEKKFLMLRFLLQTYRYLNSKET